MRGLSRVHSAHRQSAKPQSTCLIAGCATTLFRRLRTSRALGVQSRTPTAQWQGRTTGSVLQWSLTQPSEQLEFGLGSAASAIPLSTCACHPFECAQRCVESARSQTAVRGMRSLHRDILPHCRCRCVLCPLPPLPLRSARPAAQPARGDCCTPRNEQRQHGDGQGAGRRDTKNADCMSLDTPRRHAQMCVVRLANDAQALSSAVRG
jgi:hypothetical protein